jgi:O-antigen ligase
MAVIASSSSIRERIETSDEGSARSRIDMMIDAFAMIEDNYIAGVGLNNYSVVIPKYDITGIHRAWKATTVHNLFLLIAAETGLASMLLFIVIMYLIIRAGGRVLAACRLSADVICVAGLRLGIVCFLIVSTVDPAYRFYPGLQRTLWLVLGLLAGYVSLYERRKPVPLACSKNRITTRFGQASHSHV